MRLLIVVVLAILALAGCVNAPPPTPTPHQTDCEQILQLTVPGLYRTVTATKTNPALIVDRQAPGGLVGQAPSFKSRWGNYILDDVVWDAPGLGGGPNQPAGANLDFRPILYGSGEVGFAVPQGMDSDLARKEVAWFLTRVADLSPQQALAYVQAAKPDGTWEHEDGASAQHYTLHLVGQPRTDALFEDLQRLDQAKEKPAFERVAVTWPGWNATLSVPTVTFTHAANDRVTHLYVAADDWTEFATGGNQLLTHANYTVQLQAFFAALGQPVPPALDGPVSDRTGPTQCGLSTAQFKALPDGFLPG